MSEQREGYREEELVKKRAKEQNEGVNENWKCELRALMIVYALTAYLVGERRTPGKHKLCSNSSSDVQLYCIWSL